MKKDIQDAAGLWKMVTSLHSGAEATMHSMKEIFDDEQTHEVILVDASNAFNSLNRNAALHNTQILYPQFSTILINTYRVPVENNSLMRVEDRVSNGKTTQGNNLGMYVCALGTATLLSYLLYLHRM